MFEIGLFILIGFVFLGYYSAITALPLLEDNTGKTVRGVVTVVYILGIVLAPWIADHLKYIKRKDYLIYSVILVIIGIFIFPIGFYLADTYSLLLASLAIFIIAIGAVGFYIPAITLIAETSKNISFTFPIVEFFWSSGHTLGISLPLYLSENLHFFYYFISIGFVLALQLSISAIQIPDLPIKLHFDDDLKLFELLKEKEIWLDSLVIVYVVAASKCIDPVLDGILDDLKTDNELNLYFVVTSAIISFVVVTILCLFIDKFNRKTIMFIGILSSTTGLVFIGIINTATGGNTRLIFYGLIFLDLGMSIGTASGFPILMKTAEEKLKIKFDERAVDIVAGIYVSSIWLGVALGPTIMIWLTYKLEYYEAALIWFGFGVLVLLAYLNHVWELNTIKSLEETQRLIGE